MTVGAVLNDGTVRIERGHVDPLAGSVTVDDMLRDPFRIRDKLAEIAEELCMTELLFPRPIAERIHRRDGWALWRYRGVHRSGAWSVAALVDAVERQAAATATAHRRSLRRPVDPFVWIGSRYTSIRFYGVPPIDDDGVAVTATLALAPDDAPVTIPAITACDDAPTGPILFGGVDREEEVDPC